MTIQHTVCHSEGQRGFAILADEEGIFTGGVQTCRDDVAISDGRLLAEFILSIEGLRERGKHF